MGIRFILFIGIFANNKIIPVRVIHSTLTEFCKHYWAFSIQ